MRNFTIQDSRCEFDITTHSHVPNALRRALMSDITNIAPDSVTIRTNTSCQTDEYIAHRIGLIPFRALEGADDRATRLTVSGRMASASDIVSSAYAPYIDIPIMRLGPNQSLDLDITFRTGSGAEHARFSHISAVSYRVDGSKTTMGFDTITGDSPSIHIGAALDSLLKRIDDVIYFVESEYDAKHRDLTST